MRCLVWLITAIIVTVGVPVAAVELTTLVEIKARLAPGHWHLIEAGAVRP